MLIYFDNSATTRARDSVADKMVNAMTKDFGNPSSLHRLGLTAEKIVKDARAEIAKKLNASPEEIYFTSCGTESNNTIIKGAFEARRKTGKRIITTSVEHPAVLKPFQWCEERGAEAIYLPVDKNCAISLDDLKAALNEDTILVSIMYVNNESGSIMPIAEVVKLARKLAPNAIIHTDAVQAFGKIDCDVKKLGVDALSISAHKIHGPKGIGALYLKKGVHIPSFMLGGGQEQGFRSGTESVPMIAGFGQAAKEIAPAKAEIKKRMLGGLLAEFGDSIKINSPEDGIDSVLNVSFLGCRGEVLLHMLEEKEVYVSTGSACSSNSKKKGSHVLNAMGLSPDEIEGAIRFSFSDENTLEEAEYALGAITEVVNKHRKLMSRK